MNPILADMYSTVIPSAPFLIAAYALVWVVLLIYVIMVVPCSKKHWLRKRGNEPTCVTTKCLRCAAALLRFRALFPRSVRVCVIFPFRAIVPDGSVF